MFQHPLMSLITSSPTTEPATRRRENDPDAANSSPSSSRRAFLRRSAAVTVAGGATMAGAMALLGTPGKVFSASLNHASMAQSTRPYFLDIRGHENDHVDFLLTALGNEARPMPTFQNLEQADFASFMAVSQALENTGVGAYLGAAPRINSDEYLAAAGSIALIEARHAGFLNFINESPLTITALQLNQNLDFDAANNSFDEAFSVTQVTTAAGPFIKDLNGGPPISYDQKSSNANDIRILNFALALEFLEAEFYNINVHKFFVKG